MGMKYRLCDKIDRFSHREQPDTIWQAFADILAEVYGEIIHNDELLRECYCEVRSRHFDELFFPAIITKIPQAYLCANEKININQWMADILREEVDPYNPILIIGNVGSGKSTFIHHFFKVSLYKYGLNQLVNSIFIDLREYHPPLKRLEEHIYEKLDAVLKEKYIDLKEPDLNLYEKIFSDELLPYKHIYEALSSKDEANREKAKDIKKCLEDKLTYIKALLRYVKNKQKKKIYIIMDNIDHHPIEIQKEVFLLIKNLIFYFKTPIVLTMRDYTLSTAYKHCELAAFQTRYLNLSHPDLKTLLEKRMNFIIEKKIKITFYQKYSDKEIKVFLPSGFRISMDVKTLEERLRNILESLLTFKIIDILEKLSDRDMRILLDIVRVALSSGYLYPSQRQQKDEREGWKKRTRYYDFLRAIMKGNNPRYFPDGKIVNLFENEEKDYEGNQMIRYRTLKAVDVFGKDVSVTQIIKFMKSIGYDESKTLNILNNFLNRGLIEAPFHEGYDINKQDIKFLRITKTGRYYLDELVKEVAYLEEIKFATYIEEKTYLEIQDLLNKSKRASSEQVKYGLESTKKFIKYLGEEEKSESNRILKMNDESILNEYLKLGNIYEMIISNFDKTGEKILASTIEDEDIKGEEI